MFTRQGKPATKPAHVPKPVTKQPEPIQHAPKQVKNHQSHHAKHHKPPVLAITVAVITGLTLAAITIVMYLKSNQ